MKGAGIFLVGVLGGYLLYRIYTAKKDDCGCTKTGADKIADKVKEAVTDIATEVKTVTKEIFPPSVTKDYKLNGTVSQPRTLIYKNQPPVKEPVTTDSFILWYKKKQLIDQFESS